MPACPARNPPLNPPLSPAFHRGRWAVVAVATLLIPFVIGCASPGPPQPPSLRLPKVVDDLTAERAGDAVALRWTTPSRTTDDLDIKGPLTAEICRQTRPSPSPQTAPLHSNCVPVKRISIHPGPTETNDNLAAALTRDPAALLLYRVRLFNSSDRTAGPSPVAYSISGAAPPPIEQLHASATRLGVLVEWKPEPVPYTVDLDRTLIAAPASAKPKTPPPGANKSVAPKGKSFNLKPSTPAEVHLQVGEPPTAMGVVPGGTLDRAAAKGATYRYIAQRVRTVNVAGHALELRSVPSAAVTVAVRDIFPPKAPTGLAAIPSIRSIDLSWEPVSDTDVAGYIVYRQPAAPNGTPSSPAQRLTATPVTGPAFSDRTAAPGQSYRYRVTAIDTAGNESAPSAAVDETLPQP